MPNLFPILAVEAGKQSPPTSKLADALFHCCTRGSKGEKQNLSPSKGEVGEGSEVRHTGSGIGRLIWTIGIGLLFFALLVSVPANIASASPNELDPTEGFLAPALQSTATPTATLQIESTSTYSFSLATLGYDEVTLESPYGQAQYSFRLPENWAIQTDGSLDLDLSYAYNRINGEEYPALFGDLTIKLDGQTLDTFPIAESSLDHYRLRVSLPLSLLSNPDHTLHVVDLVLDAGFLCDVPHRAGLIIHPSSSISLSHSQRPLVPDLSRYPRPFYQRAFEPDSVRFVLPSQPTTNDLSNALAVAAKLGDLTSNQLVISATTDVELSELLSPARATVDEHLIVVGQPQDNQLLPLLNDVAELPVSLHQRQLGLATQGPTAVAPGDTFTYVFTITNSIDQDVHLSLVDPLPTYTELIDCTPNCTENHDDNVVTWSDTPLATAEAISFSLTLRATNTLTGATLENTVTLFEADLGPVNADTLRSAVVTDSPDSEPQVSVTEEGDYFFVYGGRTVHEGDGIIQEILSPWSQNRAILIVTGLSDEALRKASQAMSSEARFPGMSGAVALVREILPPSELNDATSGIVEMTFADLGHQDQVVHAGGSVRQLDYFFQAPHGWQLTDDAYIDLYFGHSQLLHYEDSGLTVLLNGQPIASTAFNEETTSGGHLHISLADANVQGGTNRLTLEVDASMSGACVGEEQAWILIKNSSNIYLAHREVGGLNLDLSLFPYPFHLNPTLSDLLFVLPDSPAVGEREAALRLAARLGNSAQGKTVAPLAATDSDLSAQDLEDYQVIAIGRPSRNALIQQVNDQLPQPFLPGTDEIEQRLDDVIFRLPPGFDLGYLQLISPPWSEDRALLVVTGTTDEAVASAVEVLADRPWILRPGDLALIRDGAVKTIDTRELTPSGVAVAVATAVPEVTSPTATAATTITATPSATPVPPPTSAPSTSVSEQGSDTTERPAWLIPLVAVNGLIIIGILVIAVLRARRRRS